VTADQVSEKRFRAVVEGTEKGRVYIVLPFSPSDAWGDRTRYDVSGRINGLKKRGTLEESGKGYLLPLGPAWRRDNGIRLGDTVEVILVVESSAREGLPPDIAAAFEANPEAAQFYDTLAGFYRNGYLRWIDATKRHPDVRADRITELMKLLKAGYKQRP
jgi:Domain of unknown function (DUF1905)/Bacteriocin-protection, YdeI or OmpD-Associated